MPNQQFKLFVYGSLRQGFNHVAYQYITQYFELMGRGKAKGRLYDLGAYPAAKPSEDDYKIIGELYTIIHPDEFDYAIAQLDDYEGVDASYDQISLYSRQTTSVIMDDGSEHTAWIYWYEGDIEGKPLVESGDVLEYIKAKNNLT